MKALYKPSTTQYHQYQVILTQYHQVKTSIAPYWPSTTKYQPRLPCKDPVLSYIMMSIATMSIDHNSNKRFALFTWSSYILFFAYTTIYRCKRNTCTGPYLVYFWTDLHEILAPYLKSNFQTNFCKSLPFFYFLTFEKGRLLYIHPVGRSVGWSVGRLVGWRHH